MIQEHAPRVNWCYAVPLRGGRWGACQVLGVGEQGVDVVAFDWMGKRPPTLKQLEKASALVLTHHAHRGVAQRCYAQGPVPAEFRALGERVPVMTSKMEPTAYGFWGGFELQLRLQHRWEHAVPKAEIARYRAGDEEVTLGETTRRPNYKVTVGEAVGATFPWPAGEAVPWRVLDGAGTLTKLFYYGRDAGVIQYVASRKLVTEFSWFEHGQASLDFRGASLLELRLDVTRRLKISLDEELEQLTLRGHGKGRSVTVEHPRRGEELSLRLFEPLDRVLPPAAKGLECLSELDVTWLKVIDLRAIAKAYPKLRRLTVGGKYARLEHPEALGKLTELESLTLNDVYDLDVASLPPIEQLPKLSHVCFDGLRKSDAQLIRKHLGKCPHLEVHGAKNDAWVAANANNPLRNWVDDDEAFGERACKIFAKAYRAASAAKGAAAKQALLDYIEALNKLDGKFACIDTVRREEAYEAYGQLVEVTALSIEEADVWWGELCEF